MSDLTDRIDECLAQKHITRYALAHAINVNEGTIRTWWNDDRGVIPRIDAVMKIAEYFGVSLDWLLCGKELGYGSLSKEEFELIEKYRKLDDRDKNSIQTLADGLLAQYTVTKKRVISLD